MRSAMNRMDTSRFAQVSCARFACSENTIMMIMDAVSASIFALISIISILSIRLLPAQAARNLTICQPRACLA